MSNTSLDKLKNSNIPEEIKESILASLAYYPELRNVRIDFRFKKIKTLMAARPKFDLIFRSKSRRRYLITINIDAYKAQSDLMTKMGFNAKVGLIGHELAHIVDYTTRSNYQLIKVGLGYFFKIFKIQLENKVDEITIQHDLGIQLYDFTNFVHTESCVSEKYRKYKKKYYYSPEDLLELVRERLDLISA